MTNSADSTQNQATTDQAQQQSEEQTRTAHLVVITTGGTIACTTDKQGQLIPTISGEELLRPIAARFEAGVVDIEVRELMNIDSSAVTFSDIDAIIEAVHDALDDPEVDGVVVTHGTDTMEESAMAVDVFHSDHRPVVFTGAQCAADHPEADGPGNLFESCVIAIDASARGIGTLIVFGHAVLPVRGATKWHTTDALAFATNAPEEPLRPEALPVHPLADVRVDIVPAYAGADGSMVDAAITAGARGLVIEGLGAGNVPTQFAEAVARAVQADIPVVMCTRVPRGDVFAAYGGLGGGASLQQQGVISAGCVHAPQARVILAAAIATGTHPQTLF
ncbi:asparaginase [Corynebacterium sp. H113]|uniref:asparaginase n=1 Tax=Corynebacterium sp. H113 TaxID=3133419 RepID=UPI003096D833